MAEGFAVARQNGPVENRIVRSDFCRAIDFMLNKQGLEYHALFNAPSSDEHINPPSGFPRPDPDLAVKTKGYGIPPALTADYPTRKTPSRYSGKMREAAGCYFARGAEPPFSYGLNNTTHGIVWKVVGPNTLYWLVEISGLGVFATRIKVGEDCCGSYNVEHLMPTLAEVRENSNLAQYRSTVALWWYWTYRGGTVVERLIRDDQILPVVTAGSPWLASHGWAFSASGLLAQQVLIGFGSDPVAHYVASRHKITFTVNGTILSAAATTIETGKKFIFLRNNTVWVPVVPGSWTGDPGATGNENPNPFLSINGQDAPMHVFYSGETEQVTRWHLSFSSVPETIIGNPESATENQDPVHYPATCALNQDEQTYTPWPPTFIPLIITGAHKIFNVGFSGPGFSYVSSSKSGHNVFQKTQAAGASVSSTSLGGNHFALEEGCYYYWQDPDDPLAPPVLITECSCFFQNDAVTTDVVQTQRATTDGEGAASSVVLFMEEREAILAVGNHSTSSSGSMEVHALYSQVSHEHVYPIPPSNTGDGPNADCPCYSWDIPLQGGVHSPNVDIFETSSVNDLGGAASATLAIGSFGIVHALPYAPASNDVDDFNFGTFLICTPLKSTAESGVFAMKGNVNDTNRAYYLDAMTVGGGFPYVSGEVVAFVGKV